MTARAGVQGEGYMMGAAAADFDNDGSPDLFVAGVGRSMLSRNNGGTFRDVTAMAGPDLSRPAAHRGAAAVDLDNDGRMDLIVTALGERPQLLRNVTSPEGRWLTLRLVGRISNRDGLGTIVRVVLDDGRVLVNHATTSVGYASSGDPRVHFGLGRAGQVQRLELLWPSGVHQTIERPALNRVLTIEEATTAVDQR